MNKRVIPSITVFKSEVWVTERFQRRVYGGDPLNAVRFFSDCDVDELVVSFVNFESNHEEYRLIEAIAKISMVPITIAYNLKNSKELKNLISLGIDRFAINLSLEKMPILAKIIEEMGAQALIGVVKFESTKNFSDYNVLRQIEKEFQISEKLFIDISRDGTRRGFDFEFFEKNISNKFDTPNLIRGGLSKIEEIQRGLKKDYVSGVVASSIFSLTNDGKSFLLSNPRKNGLE